jgi:hypothetical protein
LQKLAGANHFLGVFRGQLNINTPMSAKRFVDLAAKAASNYRWNDRLYRCPDGRNPVTPLGPYEILAWAQSRKSASLFGGWGSPKKH